MMDFENCKILIIDDEEIICNACSHIFCGEGYLVETCCDGLSGLEKFHTFKPDVVFIDLKMPGLNGLEVLKKIREKDTDVVLIVITGYATIESAVESMKNGAFDFLPKPFTPEELKLITKRALEKRRAALEAKSLRIEKERMRKNFISLVSHELRTPLVAVMQYLEVLCSCNVEYGVSEQQAKIINRMKIRLNELLALIDRWLKLSRIEELRLKDGFKDFPISPVINEAIDIVKPLAQEKNISLGTKYPSSDIIIEGDREMIKEVFINLLNNGIKYNRKGGKVMVKSREENDFCVIDFSDTGIGIPEKEIVHIHEEFYRIKREGIAAGFGLGLAIVKKIIDVHNGRLEIKSELDQGSTFSVHLPCSMKKAKKEI
jgi:two-component system sensor histidine kinase/response regulator